MPAEMPKTPPALLTARIIIPGVYLLFVAVILRTIANQNLGARLPTYLVLELLYGVLFSLALWRPAGGPFWKHAYFAFQSIVVLVLIALRPQFDFIVVLFVLLAFQAQLILPGRAGWVWVAALIVLTGAPLIVALGSLRGLAMTLMPITIEIVFSAYVAVTREIEAGTSNTRILLARLQDANRQLRDSASQVEELSAIEERNRLARQLHDSVSQTIFGISLHTRTIQILLERDPERLRAQLESLHSLTQNALGEMRGLIAELRPRQRESAGRPTP